MTETTLALVVLAGPLGAALLLGCVPPLRRAGRRAAFVSLAGIAVALVAAVRLVAGLWVGRAESVAHGGSAVREALMTLPWLALGGPAPLATAGVYVDALSASMAALVTLVALLVQLYSLAYMADETPAAFGRYYVYHSLFAFAMLGLVFAPNLLQLYVFWELVGLCSYLLIGFWFKRPAAGARGGEGLLGHDARRRRLAARDRGALGGDGDVQVRHALPRGGGRDRSP